MSRGIAGRRFLVCTATGPEDPPRRRGRHQARTEHAPGPQLIKVGQTLSRKSIEQIGLGSADAERGSLRADAKNTADSHW
ncbi:hypothetical protein GCM10015535_69400 [Streptomyces gelaticus]|uniref:Uncharacterized protein n=1 Tax=Streptomyces gelaticus TaxID=285446 RepID=A0ABQ2WA75_9ACTN|nr:hypothetical protein GCM10015535_69400 [Streptomyces gelaticus]